MSTWRIADMGQLDEALLAIVLSNNLVETFDVVCLDNGTLTAANIQLVDSPGDTVIDDLRNTHVDIAALDLRTLGTVAFHISNQVCGNAGVRCMVPKIVALVQAAIQAGRVAIDQIDPEYLKKLRAKGLAA